MTSYFQKQGRDLLSNGYLIVPIRVGQKRPAMDEWQHARLGQGDLAAYSNHGVGVLCGQGAYPISAVDIDTDNQQVAERFTQWCREHLGDTCERVGNAPKIMLIYRAKNAGWGKATGAWFEDTKPRYEKDGDTIRHRLEILGSGQQFVAYHIHPVTGKPYEWVDVLGGIESVRADELPIIDESQVHAALEAFERIAKDEGLRLVKKGRALYVDDRSETSDDDFLLGANPPVGMDLSTAAKKISHIDKEDYESWLHVGMALHHEFEGADEALDLWDSWSSGASNYGGRDDIEFRWSSFGGKGRSVTMRWVIKAANVLERESVKKEQIGAYNALVDEINRADTSLDLMSTGCPTVKSAQRLLRNTPALRNEVCCEFKRRYKEITGKHLSLTELNKVLREAPVPTVMSERPLTEFGNAERLMDRYGKGLMFVPELDAWYCWTGIYWRRAPNVEIEHYAKQTVYSMVAEAKRYEGDGGVFLNFCKLSQNAHMVKNVVKLASSDPRVTVPASELDKHSRYVGAKNGVIDLETGALMSPDPELRITRTLNCEYRLDR